MKFFNFFKRKSTIQIDFDISTEPLYVFTSKKIKLPTSATVNKDTELFFCDSGKVLDSFSEGSYDINIANLPNCDKRFKLSKPDRDGRLANCFYCNVYFVNKTLFKYKKWKTYRKAYCQDKRVGNFNVGLSGGYAFEIKDAKKFITAMLKEYDIIKNKEAENILSGYVGEFVLSYIEKQNLNLEQLLYPDKIVDEIFDLLNKKLDFLGVEFLGFNIEKVNLPKALKVTKQNILDEQEIGENVFKKQKPDKQKHSFFHKNEKKVKENSKITVENNQSKLEEDELLHFGNSNKNQNTTNQNNVDSVQKKEYDVYHTNVRCLFCGYENKVGDERCALCGQTLKRRGRIL